MGGVFADQNVPVEVDGGVDDRALAVMGFDGIQEHANICGNLVGRGRFRAVLRDVVPLHVEHRRQGLRIARNILDEPGDLFFDRAAEIIEVVGTARHTGLLGRIPVGHEHRVDEITALGRLDEGKFDTVPFDLMPVDLRLPAGHVDAVDREVLRHGIAVLHPRTGGQKRGKGKHGKEARAPEHVFLRVNELQTPSVKLREKS